MGQFEGIRSIKGRTLIINGGNLRGHVSVFLFELEIKEMQLLRLNELWCGITATPATPPKQLSLAM
jgi:hypothetical protein